MQALFRILLCFILLTHLFPSFAATNYERTPEQKAWVNENLTPKEIEWLNNHSTVRVRVIDNPPFYYHENGIKGISIDYIELLSEYTGTKINYINTTKPWHVDIKEFKHKEFFDLLLAVKISEERKLNMEFTNEYVQIPMVIFTKKKHQLCFTHKRFILQNGGCSERFLGYRAAKKRLSANTYYYHRNNQGSTKNPCDK